MQPKTPKLLEDIGTIRFMAMPGEIDAGTAKLMDREELRRRMSARMNGA